MHCRYGKPRIQCLSESKGIALICNCEIRSAPAQVNIRYRDYVIHHRLVNIIMILVSAVRKIRTWMRQPHSYQKVSHLYSDAQSGVCICVYANHDDQTESLVKLSLRAVVPSRAPMTLSVTRLRSNETNRQFSLLIAVSELHLPMSSHLTLPHLQLGSPCNLPSFSTFSPGTTVAIYARALASQQT